MDPLEMATFSHWSSDLGRHLSIFAPEEGSRSSTRNVVFFL